jgi:hypothetical protein
MGGKCTKGKLPEGTYHRQPRYPAFPLSCMIPYARMLPKPFARILMA